MAMSSVNRSSAREPEAGEAVRDERAREERPDHADDRDGDGVEQQPRVVEEVPDLGEVLHVGRERPRPLERPPRALPRDRPAPRVRGIDELALGAARLDQRQRRASCRRSARRRRRGPGPGRRTSAAARADRRVGLRHLVGRLERTTTERRSGDRNAATIATAMNVSTKVRSRRAAAAAGGRRSRARARPRSGRAGSWSVAVGVHAYRSPA